MAPLGPNPTEPYRGAFNALGLPDYAGGTTCPSQAGCADVSLGDGGSIVLRFVVNRLTGSGNNAFDLWVFEVGPDVEDTFVDISTDGQTWHSVGRSSGVPLASTSMPLASPQPISLASFA